MVTTSSCRTAVMIASSTESQTNVDWTDVSRPVLVPIQNAWPLSQLALRRLSRGRRAGDRSGTKQSSDFGPDYRWNSYVPHLLSGHSNIHEACGYPRDPCAPKGVQKPTTV